MFIFLLFLVLISINHNNTTVVINRSDINSECVLDHKLKDEIATYKNVTKQIMDEIINKSGERMYRQYTEFIDKFGARPAGSDVLEKAIDYMISLTIQSGISDVTTEGVHVPHWTRGHESLQMIYPRQKKMLLLGLGSSVSTPPEGITAEVIVVRSFEELDKLHHNTVKGKIVLFDAHFINYDETGKYRSQGASKAAKKGALASLVRSITPFSLYTPHAGWQSYEQNVTKIPAAAVTLEDADLMRRLQNSGATIVLNLKMFSTFDTRHSRNTIVDLKGTVNPDKLVIVSGHIDSWDVGQGAIDDGGGMMISWFAPVILKALNLRPRRTLRAILWTSEEPGLIGSAAYLKRHESDLSKINFILESDEGTFKPLGLDVGGSPLTRCVIAEILKIFSPIDKMKVSDAPGSDMAQFVRKGVPGGSLLNENERYFWFYHSEADTMDVQNERDVINCAAFWAAISYVIADLSVDIPRVS